jgi:hypothetical protein
LVLYNINGLHNPEDLDLTLHPEDGGSMDPWNIGILPQYYTASQPRRPRIYTLKMEIFMIL